MAKDQGREVSIHLTLGDSDFADQFNSIIGGLTDQLNKSGKQFAAQMERAEKSIRQSTEALSDTMANEPGRQARSKGSTSEKGVENAEKSMARANKLMQQMEKESIDAAEGASRMGTEYEEVSRVVRKLVNATENLQKAGASGKLTGEIETQNRLRKQAGKTINQLIKKVKQLARTEQISREQADQMLQDLRDGAARYSDERIRAEKAIQSVQKKSMSGFRRQMRAQVNLVDSLPEKHDEVRKQLEAQRKALLQKVEANEDNLEANERLAQVKKTISKLDEQEKQRRKAQAQQREEREKQRAAGSEMAFDKDVQGMRQRLKGEINHIEQLLDGVSERGAVTKMIFGRDSVDDDFDKLKKYRSLLEQIGKEGVEGAEALEVAQRERLELLEQEIDKLVARDQMGEASTEEQVRMNNLIEERATLLRQIENTEEQITREKKNQTVQSAKSRLSGGATGRKASRKRREENGTLAADNAALQASRLVQDAPYGLIGMVNNIDMALDSMVKLRKQSETTGEALKKMAVGSTASIMLWTNAFFAAFIVLKDYIDLAEEFGNTWDDTKAKIFGASDAVKELDEAIRKVAEKNLSLVEGLSLEDAKTKLGEVSQKLAELREERANMAAGEAGTRGLVTGREKEPSDFAQWSPSALLSSFFPDEEMIEQNKKIKDWEKRMGRLKERVAKGMGMEDAYKQAQEWGPDTVEAYKETMKDIREHSAEMASIMAAGREGEEAIPLKKDKIREDYKLKLDELDREISKVNREFLRAGKVGWNEYADQLDRRSAQLQNKKSAVKAKRDRELANVGEDGDGSGDPADGLRELIDLRHEKKRRAVEIEEEGLAEKKEIIDLELVAKKRALDRRLEDTKLKGKAEAEFADEIADRKAQAETQAERDKTEAVEKHAKKRRQIRKKNAEVELRLQKQRLSLQDDTDRTQIERSRLKMKGKVLSLDEKIAQAEAEGHAERVKYLNRRRDLQDDLHEERVADIRAETQERIRQTSKAIDEMVAGSERYNDETALLNMIQGGSIGQIIQGKRGQVQMQKREAIASARQEFAAKLREVEENERQAENTIAKEVKFYQERLRLFNWFHGEKEAIRNEYQDREDASVQEFQKNLNSTLTSQLSSRLGEVSQGLNALQKTFVANRKKHLMEQGVAEQEAARRAEEAGERRFAIKKKVAIAEALVGTYSAAMQVFNNTPGTLLPKIAAAGAALTYGFAQVAKIRAMSIEQGAKSGGGVSTSGLGSTTHSTGSQVTDSGSSFAPEGAGMSFDEKRKSAKNERASKQIEGLRGDMERHTAAIKNMKPEATMSEDTAIEAGQTYSDHKDEDTY